MATKTLPKVHILSTGIWNGVKITSQDLLDMVEAFGEKTGFKPVLKLGHSKEQNLLKQALKPSNDDKIQKDGFPSAGILTSIKKEGEKLFATISDIPEKIATIINNRGFHRFSIEAIRNAINSEGEKLPMVLTGLGLLGEDIPAVENLDDHLALFSGNNITGNVETIYFSGEFEPNKQNTKKKEEEINMADDNKVKNQELQKKIDELEKQNKELKFSKDTLNNEEIKTLQDQVNKTNETLKLTCKTLQFERDLRLEGEQKAKKDRIDIFLTKAIDDQKIFPSQKELYKGILLSANDKTQDIVIFSKDNKEEKLTSFEAVQKIVEINSILLTKEELQKGEPVIDANDHQARIIKYCKDNNLDVNKTEDLKTAYVATGEVE